MWMRVKLSEYRERFKRLDRKWHLLIGSQILFGLVVLRVHHHRQELELLQQQQEQSQATSNEKAPPKSQKN